MTPLSLEQTYLSLDGQGRVARHAGGPEFWRTVIGSGEVLGTLVTQFQSDGDWAHWEMHPGGDEILVALEGSGTIVLDAPDGERRIPMSAGDTLVVPRGVWHRGVDQRGLRMLFITYGAGTEHRPA